MLKQIVSGIVLILLLPLIFSAQPVKASGTIYVRADGSIDPPTAPIQRNGDFYAFTDDIHDSIVVEKDNIVVDGAGYTLQGAGSEKGIDLSDRSNVTIKNMKIRLFENGIWLLWSSNNIISGNNITENEWQGISLDRSSNNIISGNNIGENIFDGIYLYSSSNNSISGNNVAENNWDGIYLYSSSNNSISGNNIANNGWGASLYFSSNNSIYHNKFVNNTEQVGIIESYNSTWDNGYPSGGNYWSDYATRYPDAQELDGSGLWNTPYVIDENNRDRYPLMNPWVNIEAYCHTEGTPISVSIALDGSPTHYTTPHTFTGLIGIHTFTVPDKDPNGHPFKQWSTDETTTTITVATPRTYTAYYEYEAPPPSVGGVLVPVDKLGLLAPYIGLASTIVVATVATVIYIKCIKKEQ